MKSMNVKDFHLNQGEFPPQHVLKTFYILDGEIKLQPAIKPQTHELAIK